jgi:hypothetical protein
MLYHYSDPDEPETCPNRNDILRKFEANRESIFQAIRRPVATASELALFLQPYAAQEIDRVLLDALVRAVGFFGERAFVLRDVVAPVRYQLVENYSPAESARDYAEAYHLYHPAA